MEEENKYNSIKDIAQKSGYSEEQITKFLEDVGAIKLTVREMLFWVAGDTEIRGLVKQHSKYGTVYVDFERVVNLLDQVYKPEAE